MSAEEPKTPADEVPTLGVATTSIPDGRRLTVVGELDIATAPILAAALDEGVAAGDVEVDLSGLSFMDSSGMLALIRARKACPAGRRLVVIGASPQAARLISILGVADLLGLPTDRSERALTPGGQQTQLVAVLALAVQTIDCCDSASITIIKGPHTYTAAAHDQMAFDVDQAQYEEDNGPCLSAVRSGDAVLMPSISAGPGRYERFRASAASAEIRSSVSLPFQVSTRYRGSLNLYSRTVDGFDTDTSAAADSIIQAIKILLTDPS